mmetsp:Transcript_106217/g.307413  ORF Transcript_106217/g.307413 Transcript_106217/m.307413 type:complete len:442 (-) Transcript_106217:132-1457(-)
MGQLPLAPLPQPALPLQQLAEQPMATVGSHTSEASGAARSEDDVEQPRRDPVLSSPGIELVKPPAPERFDTDTTNEGVVPGVQMQTMVSDDLEVSFRDNLQGQTQHTQEHGEYSGIVQTSTPPTMGCREVLPQLPEEPPANVDPSDPKARLSDLLGADPRLSGEGRAYLDEFLNYLGLSIVSDLLDIEALEPLQNYFREALESYEATKGKAAPVQKAALGRLIRSVRKAPEPELQPRSFEGEDSVTSCGGSLSNAAQQMYACAPHPHNDDDTPCLTPRMLMEANRSSRCAAAAQKMTSRGSSPRAGCRASVSPRSSHRSELVGATTSMRTTASSKRGSFSQAGSGERGSRQTVLCETRRDASPGPSVYRPTIAAWDSQRPASPRAFIGTAKRETLFTQAATESWAPQSLSTAAKGRKVPSAVIGSAPRFTYGSTNRPSWMQ